MGWLYWSVGLILGSCLVGLAFVVEVWPNVAFLRGAKRYRCIFKSGRVASSPPRGEGCNTYRSELQIELTEPQAPEPRKRMATYGVHGVQDRDSGSWYGHRRAKREVARFEAGRKYDCWVLEEPSITAMTRKTLWWMSWTLGLFGALLIVLCLLTAIDAITATFTPPSPSQ